MSRSPDFLRGLEAFDAGRFHEAHEHWEQVWKAAPPEERPLYRALIQLAAACWKIERDQYAPARRLLQRSLEVLEAQSGAPLAQAARDAARDLLERLAHDRDPGDFPRLGQRDS